MDELAELKKARSRIFRYLSYRQRSRQEAADYLDRKGFSETVSAAVLTEMEQYGYIDDARYAGEVLQSFVQRGFGPVRVRLALKKKGIARELIEAGIAESFSPEKDCQRARSILEKRMDPDTDPRDERWMRRQVAYLRHRGYQEQVIIKAIKGIYNSEKFGEDG